MAIFVGADIGDIVDPTAVVIAEYKDRVYTVRRAVQLPLGSGYDAVDDLLLETAVEMWSRREPGEPVMMRLDCTGVGRPTFQRVARMIRETGIRGLGLQGVVFTYGDHLRVRAEDGLLIVGKGYMVGRTVNIMNEGRIRMTPATAAAVRKQAQSFQMRIREHERRRPTVEFGAETGAHDDLITALGLAVLIDIDVAELAGDDENDTPRLPAYLRR